MYIGKAAAGKFLHKKFRFISRKVLSVHDLFEFFFHWKCLPSVVDKVQEYSLSLFRSNGFGMKLYPFHNELPVA